MSNSETKKKKSLSGATMGMRFMQRKMGGGTMQKSSTNNNSSTTNGYNKTPTKNAMSKEGNEKETSSSSSNDATTNATPSSSHKNVYNDEDEEWIIHDDSNRMDIDDFTNQNSNTGNTQRNHEPLQNDQDSSSSITPRSSTTTTIPLVAYEITTSPTDMYGISSNIIGRKSYNSFNKSVQDTYNQALEARRKHKLDSKVEKEHISDEELLKRYKQYVKGQRTDLRNDDANNERVANDVGNLKSKLAKKRKR